MQGSNSMWPLCADASCIDADGNFCLPLDVETKDKFVITLQLADEEAGSDISGSPFSVQKLVAAQGLDAAFGRPDLTVNPPVSSSIYCLASVRPLSG